MNELKLWHLFVEKKQLLWENLPDKLVDKPEQTELQHHIIPKAHLTEFVAGAEGRPQHHARPWRDRSPAFCLDFRKLRCHEV